MRKAFSIHKYNNKGRPKLKFFVSQRINGKRMLKFFTTNREAKDYADARNIEAFSQGTDGTTFPAALRIEALACVEKLKPYGSTLTEAVKHFTEYLAATAKSCTVKELAAEFLAAKTADEKSERHMLDLRSRLNAFCVTHGEINTATVTSADIDGWLRSLRLAPQTRNNFRTVLNSFFNFAVFGGYATTNPVDKTKRAKVRREPPAILSVSQTAALLENADAEILPFIAIGVFAGLRTAELQRLEWHEVDLAGGHVEVTSRKSKTGSRRLVIISDNLRAWLQPVAKLTGSVAPANLRRRLDALHASAGLSDWPANSMRHSFASYHLAHHKNAAALALELGHEGTKMLFEHYREVVKPDAAAAFWKIAPAAEGGKKVVQMRARA